MKKIFLLFLLLLGSNTYAFDISSFFGDTVGKDRPAGLLLSDIEVRKKQVEDVTNEREVLVKRSEVAIKKLTDTIVSVEELEKEALEKTKGASGSYEELLKRKLAILDERKQNLSNLRDLWKEVDLKMANHLKLAENIVEILSADFGAKEGKLIYSWKALDEVKGSIDQLSARIEAENGQKERIKKLKAAEKDEVVSLKNDIEQKRVEQEKITKELEILSDKADNLAIVTELKTRAEIIDQELYALREKIDASEFKIESFGRDEHQKDGEIFLLKHKLKKLSNELAIVQKKLVIDISDVEFSKGELEKAKREAAFEAVGLSRTKNLLKLRRDGLEKNIRVLEYQFDEVQKAGKEKSPTGYWIVARLSFLKNEKVLIDKSLEALDTKKERFDLNVRLKELKTQAIEVLHSMGTSTTKIDNKITEFKAKLRAAENTKKSLKDRRDEVTNYISTINKERELVLLKQKEIVDQRDVLFQNFAKEYFEVLSHIKGALSALSNQKKTVERHFSQISEFLVWEDDFINQCSFIIKHLEMQKAESVWKRASRAISLAQVGTAIVESEELFQGLFWETPDYLSPSTLFKTIKGFEFGDYLGIIIFSILFIVFFFLFRFLLLLIQRNVRYWIKGGGTSHALVTGIESFIEFIFDHFKLLFTWSFVFIHVVFGLTYFRPLASIYSHTVFYLLTIPILVHLSYCFVMRLQTLNQQLQYIFFSEHLQWKVDILVSIFLYASSIILPLRKAFLVYFDRSVEFSDVSLAAYTLILVLVILFSFNKEDILRLVSGRNKIVVWLRMGVERYYYPVFVFLIFLLMLSNPYIGYSNLAWYLAFAVPATLLIFYGLFFIHYVVRRYSFFFFIKEEDDEVINKFEHAKAYYGLFIALSFIVLLLIALVMLVRLWGVEGYTLSALWKSLSEDWVIRTGLRPEDKLGFVELGKLSLFISSGLVFSSFIKKFLLRKLFEIFRTEAGVQNTISKMLHYFIIIVVVILGFTSINLSQYALTAGGLLLVGIGFGLRDQIVDYFAGILVLIERPIEIGHYVEAGEFQGKVHRISARSTTLKTARNFFVTIPNRDLISKPIVNWGQGRYAVGCELKVTVAFDSDLDLVRKTLLDTMKYHSKVLRVPAPLVRFEGFEGSSLYFYCRCYISARKVFDMCDLESDLRFAIMKAFHKQGIVIPYPQTVVHFAKKTGLADANPVEIKFDSKEN